MSVLGALSNSMTGVKVPSFLISHHIAGVGGLCVAATCHQAWESSQPTLQQLRKAKQRDTKFWTTLTCAPGIPPRFVRSEELWWSGLGQGPTRWKKSEVHAFQRLLSAVHVWCWVLSSAKSVQSDCQTAHNFFRLNPRFLLDLQPKSEAHPNSHCLLGGLFVDNLLA